MEVGDKIYLVSEYHNNGYFNKCFKSELEASGWMLARYCTICKNLNYIPDYEYSIKFDHAEIGFKDDRVIPYYQWTIETLLVE